METLEVIPDAVALIEAMRAVGYSVESAIADLIDNSISANAEKIIVRYDASDAPFVAILDNGHGMEPVELTNAMRHGSRNPTDPRDYKDLGRFGLGLKTASLSQCRKLTVVSKKSNEVSARCWDLDVVQDTSRWLVVVPDRRACEALPLYASLVEQESGTLVVWEDLDRLTAGSVNPQSEMTAKLAYLYDHLSLVFHRFTQREGSNSPIEIVLNGLTIAPKDPFLKENTFRQPLEGQVIRHEKGNVHVTPYVLPPVSHLSAEEIELAGGKEGLRGTQGFYIYRNRRLVMWGTWFRLVPKDEFYKLTRVQVDIPNTFDELWALDIKKSAAYPPDVIRVRLRELIPHFASTSQRTITYSGRKQRLGNFVPLWQRITLGLQRFKYELNLDHPVVSGLSERLGKDEQKYLQSLLDLLSAALPYESIYADMCTDQKLSDAEQLEDLVSISETLIEVTGFRIEQVLELDPIARFPQFHQRIQQELE